MATSLNYYVLPQQIVFCVLCAVEVEYRVIAGEEEALTVLRVIVRQTVRQLTGPVAFTSQPKTYVDEPTQFAFLAARNHSSLRYEIEYGDETSTATFNASGKISPIPDWAGAAAAEAFGDDVHECIGSELNHVYTDVGTYIVRVLVTADPQQTGGRLFDALELTQIVEVLERQRDLAQVMSSARVFRNLTTYHNELYVHLLFHADEFPDTLSLSVNFGDHNEPLIVQRLFGDSIPQWFTSGRFKDVTYRAAVDTDVAVAATSRRLPFFGVEKGRYFARPGTYDVRFVVKGTVPGFEATQRVLIVARVDVTDTRLESQLAGGPQIFALRSPISSGTVTELVLVVRRLIVGVWFSIDFGDGSGSQPVSVNEFQIESLLNELLVSKFNLSEPFSASGRSVKVYGRVVRHVYREAGYYSAVATASVTLNDDTDVVFTSLSTVIRVVDHFKPPLSQLLGDDALVVSTPLYSKTGFQAFYISTHRVAEEARYTFDFGDQSEQKEGRSCTEWPHVDDSNQTIAGRLPLDEARNGSAGNAVCVSHQYAIPGKYIVRVRVLVPPTGVLQKTWNLGGQVTVLPGPATSVSEGSHCHHVVQCRCFDLS